MTSREINKSNQLRLKMLEQTRRDRLELEWKRQADRELLIAFIGVLITVLAGYILL